MNSLRLLGRVKGAFKALKVGATVLLLTVALGVCVDAWIVAHATSVPENQVVHIRRYVLPLGGLVAFALILWRQVLPAFGDAFRAAFTGEPRGQFVRLAFRAIVWLAIAIVVLESAARFQKHLYGVFLPN